MEIINLSQGSVALDLDGKQCFESPCITFKETIE